MDADIFYVKKLLTEYHSLDERDDVAHELALYCGDLVAEVEELRAANDRKDRELSDALAQVARYEAAVEVLAVQLAAQGEAVELLRRWLAWGDQGDWNAWLAVAEDARRLLAAVDRLHEGER